MPVSRKVAKPRRSGKKTSLKKTRKRNKKPISFLPVQTGDERVLALDTSSTCVGWAVFDNGSLVQHGRFVQQGHGHGEKMTNFRLWILGMLAEFRPTHLIYEAPYRGRNGSIFGLLSKYAGVVDAAAFEFFQAELAPECVVPAKDVKRAIGAPKVLPGRGKRKRKSSDEQHSQNKRVVLTMVNERFGLGLKYEKNDKTKKVSQDDEADAIALNWAWHLMYRSPEPVSE